MKEFELVITLLSDLSPGNGDSVAGLIDSEIANEYGLPIIPAKRLKGALQHVGKELVDWGLVEQRELDNLFGAAGQAESGPIQFFDATLYKIPRSFYMDEEKEESTSITEKSAKELVIEHYVPFVQRLLKEESIHPNELLHLFSTVRARTAIDIETNTAKTQSLRTMRVVHRGLTFKSKIVLNTTNEESERLLEMCVQGLRRLGLGSTRGLGEVACQIHRVDSSPSVWKVPLPETTRDDEEIELLFRITLEQPVMIAGSQGLYHSCADWIPGGTLLGAFAGMYIADHGLGEKAHQDETFSRIFLRDGVAFGYAYPEIGGKRFAPCPAHWQREKNKNAAYAISQEKPQQNGKQEGIVLRSIGALAFLQEDDTLLLHEPEKEVRMHYSRPDNRGIGRPLGEEPREEENEKIYGRRGQFFQYTALRQGQSFIGSLRGKKQDIHALLTCIEKRNGKLRLGRSRTAEYGNVTMELLADSEASSLLMEKGQHSIGTAKPFAICLTTPMLLMDQAGRPDPDPAHFLTEVQGALKVKLKLEKQFLKQTILSGYNGKWRMPKPKQTALDAGTVLIVSVMDGTVDRDKLESRLWGANTGEGCGQLKVIAMESLQETKKMKVEWMQSPSSSRTQVDPTKAELAKIVIETLTNKIIKEREKKKHAIEGRDRAKQLLEQEPQLLEMGQTKLYQLYLHLTEKQVMRFLEEQENNEKFKKVIDVCENQSLSFIKAFFHTFKLEVRKAHG